LKSRIAAFGLAMITLACSQTVPPASPASAPSATPPSGSPASPDRLRLRPGQSAEVPGGTKIGFEEVRWDNRCAVDVQCISAGEATMSLRLDRPGSMSVYFQLDTAQNREATVNGYRVAVYSLAPAPKSTVKIAPGDYVLELAVSRE
jgi:hypothetical protein